MNFNKFLKSLFGDKSTRDMKLIQPFVEQAKAAAAKVQPLDNDALRQRTKELQKQVQDSASAQKAKIAELKGTTLEEVAARTTQNAQELFGI
jgi:preprotein translocase subunit SecA